MFKSKMIEHLVLICSEEPLAWPEEKKKKACSFVKTYGMATEEKNEIRQAELNLMCS